jgi:hypothetical protein
MLGGKYGRAAVDDSLQQIVADTRRYREDALQQLEAIKTGEEVPAMRGNSRDEAVKLLTDNIATCDELIRRFGRRDDA